MGDLSPRGRIGGFKNFLASDKGAERNRKREIANIKTSLERGTYLPAPKVDVAGEEVSFDGDYAGYAAATASMQGWRCANEDTAVLKTITCGDGETRIFMGCYDGHGGIAVSQYLEAHLHVALAALSDFTEASLQRAFEKVDSDIRDSMESEAATTGATCSVVLIDRNSIICANTGDCRAVLSRGGAHVALSVDHNPESDVEKARIRAAGCEVSGGRIEGMLNVSRAFGDFEFKKKDLPAHEQAIAATCDVTITPRAPGDEFVLQACDGIWGSLDGPQCIARIAPAGGLSPPLIPATESLFRGILAASSESAAGTDNMTMNVLSFKQG